MTKSDVRLGGNQTGAVIGWVGVRRGPTASVGLRLSPCLIGLKIAPGDEHVDASGG